MQHDPNQILSIDTKSYLSWFHEEYNQYIYKQAWNYTTDPHEVEELVQNFWVRICNKVDVLSKMNKPKHLCYISATIKNLYLDEKKRRERQPLELSYDTVYNEIDFLPYLLERRFKAQQFKALWPQLDPATQRILELKYIQKESDSEIAKQLGIKPSSVRMYVFRARKKALALLHRYKDLLL